MDVEGPAAWTFHPGFVDQEPVLVQGAEAVVEGRCLAWRPELGRSQWLIVIAVGIQVTSVVEVSWTGDFGAAVPEERAVVGEVLLSGKMEIPEADVDLLKRTYTRDSYKVQKTCIKQGADAWAQ